MVIRGYALTSMDIFWAIVTGLIVGAIMSVVTEYYTAMGKNQLIQSYNNLQQVMLPTSLVV